MAKAKASASSEDILKEAKEAFAQCEDAEADNRREALDDIRFARLAEQWPADILVQRQREGRPALTINKMPAFIRQVVNDARQNKPSIKVHPADSGADPETAEIYNGLIRNIEYTSNADVAYDTATECGVANGFGYIRVGLDYAFEDTFDLDIRIDRVANPFSVYADPMSTAADSSDWKVAFVVETMKKAEFEREYPKAAKTNWDADFEGMEEPWITDDTVMTAEYWTREEYDKPVLMLSDGTVIAEDMLKESEELQALLGAGALQVTMQRTAKCWRVKQRILTGAEVLKERDWPGQYIPIIPVYGDEVNVEGKRYFRSLIRDAKDAQRMFNYWRSASTELVALAPKTPFVGEEGAFSVGEEKWATANNASYPYLEHKRGTAPPQRQPFVGVPAGVLQEALNASDDMKAIIGLYDASLGARSNETSGKAIMARQREGDVSTFHFIDNMARAIRHTGRVIIDLIPKVYTGKRILRVLGEDGTPKPAPLNQPVPVTDKQGQPQMQPNPQAGMPGPDGAPQPPQIPMTRVYDLSAGKYDLTVVTGPSFTTRREEAAQQMTELIRAFPAAAPVLGDLLAKNLDWPGADEVAERMKALVPPQAQGGLPPEVQQMIEEGKATIQQLTTENASLKAGTAVKQQEMQIDQQAAQLDAQLKGKELQLKELELQIKQFEAQTDRIQALKPEPPVVAPQGPPRKAA